MAIFFITLGFMLLVAVMLGIGSIMGRKPLAGSCGGVGKALAEPNYECPLCGGDESKCDSRIEDAEILNESVQTFDATKK